MKNLFNKVFSSFGFEIHGTGYMRKLKAERTVKDAFMVQKQRVPNPKIIFDLGANQGDVCEKYRKLFPSADVHAFEPIPLMIDRLKAKNLTQVFINQYALSNKIGKTKFHVNKSMDTSSLLKSKKIGASSDKQVVEVEQIEVNTTTIDHYCETNKINYIDILKLDVQGGELAVLQGAKKMLSEKKIGLIYSEAYFKQQYKEQALFSELVSLLNSYNYFVEDTYNPYYNENHLLWCDFIAIQ